VIVFGHLGDGNLHVLVAPRPWDDALRHRAEELVYLPLKALGGSLSAEHGIGLEKRDWLHVSRTPEELGLMREVKAMLDPYGLLNPGKVLAEPALPRSHALRHDLARRVTGRNRERMK
jgi:FAD/FMN-containing dehydrogenase